MVGAATLPRPAAVARLVSGPGSTPNAAVLRVLGGRQLPQGTAVLIRPAPILVIGGSAGRRPARDQHERGGVSWPGYRRAALASAAVAGGSAAAGALVLRGAQR
jgi:hypothetical protein